MKTLLIALLTLFTQLSYGQINDKYENYFQSLMEKQEYDTLISFFENELIERPKNDFILQKLGFIFFYKKDFVKGEYYYNKALTLNPNCASCYINMGKAYSNNGDNQRALEYFDKAINVEPNNPLLYSDRAKLKEMMNDKLGALTDHEKAVEKDPNNAECYLNRGLFNANNGYAFLAIADYNKAIKLSPPNYYPHYLIAQVHWNQNNTKEALIHVNNALQIDSNQYQVFLLKGDILEKQGDHQSAIVAYTNGILLNNKEYYLYWKRATNYYSLENLNAACDDISIIKTKIDNNEITDPSFIQHIKSTAEDICNPNTPSYYYQRGIANFNLKEYNAALVMYDKGLELFPNNSMILNFKANTLLELHEYEQAIKLYNLSLNHQNDILKELKNTLGYKFDNKTDIEDYKLGYLASTYYSLAKCKTFLKQYDKALIDINKAIEHIETVNFPQKNEYYNWRGYIYLIQKKYNQALTDFDKSIDLNSKYPATFVNRAIAKISVAGKVKKHNFSSQSKLRSHKLTINWFEINKSDNKKMESKLQSALNDCSIAIGMNKDYGYAYYIRGQIKRLMQQNDYCIDFLTAEKNGVNVEEELMLNCKK